MPGGVRGQGRRLPFLLDWRSFFRVGAVSVGFRYNASQNFAAGAASVGIFKPKRLAAPAAPVSFEPCDTDQG